MQLRSLLLDNDFTLRCHPFHPQILESRALQIIAFSDAVFGYLEKMSSLGSGLILTGLSLFHNGPSECDGHSIWWVGRKLRRIARSSLACAEASLATVADLAICWLGRIALPLLFCLEENSLLCGYRLMMHLPIPLYLTIKLHTWKNIYIFYMYLFWCLAGVLFGMVF